MAQGNEYSKNTHKNAGIHTLRYFYHDYTVETLQHRNQNKFCKIKVKTNKRKWSSLIKKKNTYTHTKLLRELYKHFGALSVKITVLTYNNTIQTLLHA